MPTINLNEKNLIEEVEQTISEVDSLVSWIETLENEIPGSLRTLTDVSVALGPAED